MANLRTKDGVMPGSNPGKMGNDNVVVKPADVWGIEHKEMNSQNTAIHAGDTATRKKFGPAADHFGGNPTSNGGINRPTKGRP